MRPEIISKRNPMLKLLDFIVLCVLVLKFS
jgi:hypothetical protein